MGLSEQIGIYQQGAKTTIVIYNLKESTKQKLFEVLLSDVSAGTDAFEEIADLKASVPDIKGQAPVIGMESARVNGIVSKCIDSPVNLIRELGTVYISGIPEEKSAAALKLADFLDTFAVQASQEEKADILKRFFLVKEFASCLKKMAEQKGCGVGLNTGTPEYSEAVSKVVPLCSGEQLTDGFHYIAGQFRKSVQK